ncbi:MAG: trypsin-like peptidase domain-containing protein [Paracoccaceae bacterium]
MSRLICLIFLVGPVVANAHPTRTAHFPGPEAGLILRSADREERFLGSAFVLGSPDVILTNAHVVGVAEHVLIEDAQGQRLLARVVARDDLRDLALLRAEDDIGQPLSAATEPAQPGDVVFAIGTPLDAGLSVTAGVLSAIGRQVDPQQPVAYLQHSAPVNPGSSGGPLLDDQGHVLGINTRIADGSRYFVGIAYAVPIADVLAFLEAPHAEQPPNPGFQVRTLTPRIVAALGLPDRRGVLVESVSSGGPADRAGVLAGDVLLSFGGAPIARPGDIALRLAEAPMPGDLSVWRNGAVLDLPLELAEVQQPLTSGGSALVGRKSAYTLAEMGMQVGRDGRIVDMVDGSIGFYSGLGLEDQIIAVDGVRLNALPAGWQTDRTFTMAVLLLLQRQDGSTRHVIVDPWSNTRKLRPVSGANVLDEAVVSFD